MSPIRGGRGGGVSRAIFTGFQILGPPSRILLGHFHGIVNISSESSARAPSNGTLLGCIGLGGGSMDMSKIQGHTRSGATAGRVKPMKQQFTPNLQVCASVK